MRLPNTTSIKATAFTALLGLATAAAVTLITSASANATIIGVSASGGSTGDLVINNSCTNEVDTGMLITGCLNSNHDSDVNFISNEQIEFGNGGGQATVNAVDGLMQTITIDPELFTLNRLILDIDASANGWAQFCDNNGCWGTLLAVSKNGSNFFDIDFNPTADFLTVNTFSNSGGTTAAQLIANTKQWRVGVAIPTETEVLITEVPEPFTLSLFGAGIAGAVALRRRKKA
jgi:hypothetical protein